MSSTPATDPAVYSGYKLLPAAIALLELVDVPGALTTEQVRRRGTFGRDDWIETVATIDWQKLEDPRHSSTTGRIAEIARSLLDDRPVDLREITHFTANTADAVLAALAKAWDEDR